MLSFIYQRVRDFEHNHGFSPNQLLLNPSHAEQLRDCFTEQLCLQTIMDLLHMTLVIQPDLVHPQVAWSQNHYH